MSTSITSSRLLEVLELSAVVLLVVELFAFAPALLL